MFDGQVLQSSAWWFQVSNIYIYINISQMGCTRHLSKNTRKTRCSNESLNMLIHRVYFFVSDDDPPIRHHIVSSYMWIIIN